MTIFCRESEVRKQKLEMRGQRQTAGKWPSLISCFCVFCFFFIIFCALSFASKDNNVLRVEVLGSIPASIDTADPGNAALGDALRKAVAKAVESLAPKGGVDAALLILDDKIYSNASRYIVNYRILSKEIIEDENSIAEGGVPVYNVSIEADIAIELLTKDLIAAGILHEAEVKKIAVSIFGLRNYKMFELFKKNVRGIKGVKDISYNSFAKGTIEMFVDMAGDAATLKQALMSAILLSGIDEKEWKVDASVVQGWFSMEKVEIIFSQLK